MTPTVSVVRTATTAVETDLALRAGGFHPTELSTSSHFSIAGAAISYAIEVPSEELAAAQEFLSSFESEAQTAPAVTGNKP